MPVPWLGWTGLRRLEVVEEDLDFLVSGVMQQAREKLEAAMGH
jgi:hypothetical protein